MKTILTIGVFLFSTGIAHAQPDINWAKFLKRNDPVWTCLPQKFDHGAFAGNGLIGATLFQQGPSTLRFAMGRSDVTEHRRDNTRLLLGGLHLNLAGVIKAGTLRTVLYDAEIQGSVETDKGEVSFRALVHAKEPVLLVEASTKGEEKIEWVFKNQTNLFSNARYAFPEDTPHPASTSGKVGDIEWCEQKRASGGAFTIAWMSDACDPSSAQLQRIFLTIADTFPTDESKKIAFETLKQVSAMPIEDFIKTHRAWWHAYYPQSFVSVPDAQIEGFYWNQIYKLASAMRADGPVMDLQGPWNRETGWARIWLNLNIQIAYSPVYAANRLELGESYLNFMDNKRANFVKNAKEIYNIDDGATTVHTTCYEGLIGNGQAKKSWPRFTNPGDFVWTLHLYYQHYRFSMDESLVTDREKHAFFDLLKGSIRCYKNLLTAGPDGKLHLPVQHSPEYGEAPDNNYNLSLLRWGCTTLLELNQRHKLNDPQATEWEQTLRDLTPHPTDENGFMVGAGVPFKHSHRHWSHMLMVWPLHQLSCEQPENKSVVEKTLMHWLTVENGKQVYGWSAAAASHLYATMGDGENAVKQLRSHHNNKRFVMPNTQYIEGSPVYECSLVAASSLQYMMLQSWGNTIRIFPGMPAEWKAASYEKLRTEGAFLVSAIRKEGKTSWVKIQSLAGEPCRIKPNFSGTFTCDQPEKLKDLGNGLYALALKKGETVLLYQGEAKQKISPCDLGDQKQNFWGVKHSSAELDAPVLNLKGALSLGKPATASSSFSKAYDANKGTDGKAETRWSVAGGKTTGWLEIDLQSEMSFARVDLYEFEQRISSWSLEIKDGETWKPVTKGEMIGAQRTLSFAPVKARYVRFNILDSTNGAPSLFEFHVFEK